MSKGKEAEKSTKDSKSIDDYTDDYVIKPKYDDPKFKTLMKAFEQQEHRFEIDTCEFKYNGKSFFLGDSMEAIEAIFGEADAYTETFDKEAIFLSYDKLNISLSVNSSDNRVNKFGIGFSDYRNKLNHSFNIILFRKVPYEIKMTLNEYMDLSDLNHDKLKRKGSGFYMRQKECPPNNTSLIYTSIGAIASYESEGIGHLTYSGAFDPETSSPIMGLSIKIETLEDILK